MHDNKSQGDNHPKRRKIDEIGNEEKSEDASKSDEMSFNTTESVVLVSDKSTPNESPSIYILNELSRR